MAWVMMEVVRKEGEMDAGKLRQVLWNRAGSEMGLEGLDVTVKYGATTAKGEEGGKEVLLMFQGRPLNGVDEQEGTRTCG